MLVIHSAGKITLSFHFFVSYFSVKKIHKLECDFRNEGENLEVELGQHLVRNVKGLLRQGLIDMQKKMVQDVVSKSSFMFHDILYSNVGTMIIIKHFNIDLG